MDLSKDKVEKVKRSLKDKTSDELLALIRDKNTDNLVRLQAILMPQVDQIAALNACHKISTDRTELVGWRCVALSLMPRIERVVKLATQLVLDPTDALEMREAILFQYEGFTDEMRSELLAKIMDNPLESEIFRNMLRAKIFSMVSGTGDGRRFDAVA